MIKPVRDANYFIEHSLQRFKKRYGSTLPLKTFHDWNRKIRDIISGIAYQTCITIISKITVTKTNDLYIVTITHDGKKIYANFETERNCITTFLPTKTFE